MEPNKKQEETKIDVDCGLTRLRNRSLQAKKLLEKKNCAVPKFSIVDSQPTDEDIYDLMGSVFVLILIAFVIFVHFMFEWEMSLDLDYTTPNTCTK